MIFFLFLLVLGYAYVCNDDTRVMKEKIGILKQNKSLFKFYLITS